MKTTVAILGFFLIAGAGYYFFFYRRPPAVDYVYQSFLQRISELGRAKDGSVELFNNVNSLAKQGSQKFSDFKNLLKDSEQIASDTINGISSGLKDYLPVKTPIVSPGKSDFGIAFDPLFASSSGPSASDLSSEICTSFLRGDSINYLIGNPFNPARAFKYHIDWGDKNFLDGSTAVGDTSLSVVHVYSRVGEYVNSFKIISGTTTLVAMRQICIK